jgi:hypothetical protein
MLLAFIRFRWVDNTSARDFSQMVFPGPETAEVHMRQKRRVRTATIDVFIFGDF